MKVNSRFYILKKTYTHFLTIGVSLFFLFSCAKSQTEQSSMEEGPTNEEIHKIYTHYIKGHYSEYVSHIASCQGKPRFYREQIIKDIPLGRKTYIHLRKRRYVCPHCNKRFYEKNLFLARYHRTTTRLVAAVITAFRKLQPAKEIASQFNLSSTTALRYFDLVEYRCSKLPEVLSIDEFKGNAGGEKYQCILTDADQRKVMDIIL